LIAPVSRPTIAGLARSPKNLARATHLERIHGQAHSQGPRQGVGRRGGGDSPRSLRCPSGSLRRYTRLGAASRRHASASPVIGANHGHINGQVTSVIRGGGELVSYYVKEPELRAPFAKRYPNAKAADDERAILDDKSIQLVVSASIPTSALRSARE
jgi:hypothetical protein